MPHQDDAIKDILTALKDEDRATALMACGTGKTLIALWVSEQMNCQNILVLLPSLTLVRQTLHEWLKETEWLHLSYLCVCSDSTVAGKELDSIKVNQSDLDFAVTTDSSSVKQFLSQCTEGVKLYSLLISLLILLLKVWIIIISLILAYSMKHIKQQEEKTKNLVFL